MSERVRLILERAQSGYRLRDAATGEPVRWEDPRIRVVPAAGVSIAPTRCRTTRSNRVAGARARARQRARSKRDRDLERERTLQVGYVPRDVAPELAGDEQAVSLWRVEGGLRVLIVPADAWVGRPR